MSGVVYLPAGMTNTVTVEVIISGQYAPPTDTTVGVLQVDGQAPISLSFPPNGGSSFAVDIPAVTVPAGESRQAHLLLKVNTPLGSKQIRKVYRFIDVFDIPTDRDTVRSLLGVRDYEIPDHEIPLDQIYLSSYSRDFSAAFHLARSSDSTLTDQFGEYLSVKTALAVIPKMTMLLSKKQTSENGEFSRLGTASDLETLVESLQARLNELATILEDYLTDTGFGNLNSLRLIELTPDEITGV